MKTIYFVRHGQSEGNKNSYLVGKDGVLSDQGEHQAILVGERFANLDIDILYASDFVRAQQTAEPISAVTGLSIVRESMFGEYLESSELLGLAEDDERVLSYRSERNQRIESDPNWKSGDGETVQEFMDRIQAAKSFLENDTRNSIAVVSHAFFIQSFIGAILLNTTVPSLAWFSALRTLKTSNAGISLLTYDDNQWRVMMFNDHAHFAE